MRNTNHMGAVLVSLAVVLLAGCYKHKPAAQVRADELASQVRSEVGCTQQLREWFDGMESQSRTGNVVTLPDGLTSEWWRGVRAGAVWSDQGRLEKIGIGSGNVWDTYIVIGRASDTAKTLGLTQGPGEPPAFYAEITNGMYAVTPYYK
jgi:outer membrane murein-binding lipoprotein Lpp